MVILISRLLDLMVKKARTRFGASVASRIGSGKKAAAAAAVMVEVVVVVVDGGGGGAPAAACLAACA